MGGGSCDRRREGSGLREAGTGGGYDLSSGFADVLYRKEENAQMRKLVRFP